MKKIAETGKDHVHRVGKETGSALKMIGENRLQEEDQHLQARNVMLMIEIDKLMIERILAEGIQVTVLTVPEHLMLRGKFRLVELFSVINHTFFFLGTVRLDVKGNRDRRQEFDHLLHDREHLLDHEHHQPRSKDHRQAEEVFQKVRRINIEEVLVQLAEGFDHLRLDTEEVQDVVTVLQQLAQTGTVELPHQTSVTIVDLSHHHSATRWIHLRDTNQIQPLAIRNWRDNNNLCRKSTTSQNGTTPRHQSDQLSMTESTEYSLTLQLTLLTPLLLTATSRKAIHIQCNMKIFIMECFIQNCITIIIRCHLHLFTYIRTHSYLNH